MGAALAHMWPTNALPPARQRVLLRAKEILLDGMIPLPELCDLILQYADGFEAQKFAAIEQNGFVESLTWINHEQLAICAGGLIRVWNVVTDQIVQTFACNCNLMLVLNKSKLVCATFNMIYMWDIETGRFELSMEHGGNQGVYAMDALGNSGIVIVTWEGGMYARDLITGERVWTYDHLYESSNDVLFAVASIGGDEFITGGCDGHLRVWSTHSAKPTKTLYGHTDNVISLAVLSRDRVASGSGDETVRVWSLEKGECTMVIQVQPTSRHFLTALDPFTIATSEFGRISLRDTNTGALLCEIRDPQHLYARRIFSAHGHQLAFGESSAGNSPRATFIVWQ